MKWLFPVLTASVLLTSCSDEAVVRSDKPLTGAAASAKLGYNFPPSAHGVYFLTFSGGLQDLESYTRMDVSPSELDAAVDELIANNNASLSRSLPYPKGPLSSAHLTPPRKEFLPMPWWDPTSVSVGYFRGEEKSYALQILVDETLSRIYVYQSD